MILSEKRGFMKFTEAIKKQRLIFDGGMGSLLQKRVDDLGSIPEELVITHPDIIRQIHREYVAAGSDILTTCTFGAGGYKLKDSRYSQKEIVEAAVRLAREAEPAYVALDVGPIGALIGALGEISFAEAYHYFADLVRCGAQAGADLILIETMTDIYEAKAAVLAARENSDLPVVVSMTYEANGRTLTGSNPLTVVTILEGLGVDAIGINCSTGPDKMLPVVEALLEEATVPLLVQPNAGLPRVENGETRYDIDADVFSDYMQQIAEKGAVLLGGCCGTTPAYIRKTVEKTKAIPFVYPKRKDAFKTRVATGTGTLTLGEDICVIGECINPTTNPALKEELRQGEFRLLKKLALEQKKCGAAILDVNLGLPEIDEKDMMLKAVEILSELVDIPLQIDSSDPDVLEAVLRCYNGKPIINSVNGDAASLARILPLARKYGACVLGLTMDDDGIPESAEKRLEIGQRIIDTAAFYGIGRQDILLDCLVLTVSAQQEAVGETLKALTMIRERLAVPTVLGVSNISFGLPDRELMNRTFLAMAFSAGLTAPIMNPCDRDMMGTVAAFRSLKGLDANCRDYVSQCGTAREAEPLSEEPGGPAAEAETDLVQIVVEGDKDAAKDATEKLLETVEPLAIVNDYLIPGLDIVGAQFETGEAFLPNLIFAAETVQNAFEVIKGHLSTEEQLSKGTIILATVEGDVHDIGKNILKVILENYGYTILDLGKDVAADRIIDAVQAHRVRLVGLSALMTTTVKSMEAAIKAIKATCPETVVMVGGAVMNAEYARDIGADYYGKDAKAGVTIAQTVFGE